MNKEKLSKIISIFILLNPFLDLLTGILVHNNINITIGIIIRVVFLLFIMLITTYIYKNKSALYVYLALLVYSILYVVGIYLYKDGVGLFYEIQGLIKVIYFPVLIYSLYLIRDELDISINTLYYTLVIYVLLIFIPTICGIGYKTYEITKSGHLGFFNSANEISGIISILTPIIFIELKSKKNLLLQVLFIIIYLYTILNMGTKTPLLSLIITLFVIGIYLVIKSIKKKNYKLVSSFIGIIIVLVTSIILVLPKTNFYKNIRVHLDYLGVDHISEVFSEVNLIDHFIFSQRLTFLSDEKYLYDNSNIYQKIIGRGYLYDGEETKLIEMDYFDIYFHHGPILFIFIMSLYFCILYELFKNRDMFSFNSLMIYISSFLILILSLLTGHIIIAPSVNIFVVVILLMIENSKSNSVDLLENNN